MNQEGLYCIHCQTAVHLDCKEALHKICNGIPVPWEEVYAERGIAFYYEGNYKNAIEDFSWALRCCMVEENYGYYVACRGLAKYRLGLFKECYDDLKKAIESDVKFCDDYLLTIFRWLTGVINIDDGCISGQETTEMPNYFNTSM